MEVDDIIQAVAAATAEIRGAHAARVLVSAASRNQLLLKSRCDFAAS